MNTAQPSTDRQFSCPLLLVCLLCGTPLLAEPRVELVFSPQPIPVDGSAVLPGPSSPVTAEVLPFSAPWAIGPVAPDATTAGQRDIARYTASIRELEASEGPYAAGLAQQYLALGQLYQQQAEHAPALEQLSKAEHLYRVNFGLNAPEQYVAVEASIASYLALHDYHMAIERQEYLVHLHASHYGRESVELVPALVALGDMYFAAFERGIHHAREEKEPVPAFGPQTGFIDPRALSPLDLAFLWLDQAQASYFRSIKNLLGHEDYFNPLLLSLENNLIETLFLQAHRPGIERDPEFFLSQGDTQVRDTLKFDARNRKLPGYRDGTDAFTRILAYLENNPAVQPAQVAAAMLEFGDWHLLFGKHKQGLRLYRQAQEYLREKGVSESEINALLAPAVPVQLPVFLGHATGESGSVPRYEGFIDVAFSLDRNGLVEEIEVLDKSENADQATEARLKKVLRNAPFRPRLALAENSGSTEEKIAVRYNFARL